MKETSKSMLKRKNKTNIDDLATWQQTAYLGKPQKTENPYANKEQLSKAIEIPEVRPSPYKTIIKVGNKKKQIYRAQNPAIVAYAFESDVNS